MQRSILLPTDWSSFSGIQTAGKAQFGGFQEGFACGRHVITTAGAHSSPSSLHSPRRWQACMRRQRLSYQLWVPDFVTVLITWHQGLNAKNYSSSGNQTNVRPAVATLVIGSMGLKFLMISRPVKRSHSGRAPRRPGDAFSTADAILKNIFAMLCNAVNSVPGNGQIASRKVVQTKHP